MKKYVLFASAILAFASCASDSFTGTEEAGRVAQGEKPISFGFDVPMATRAEGAEAAGKLNNQFIVYAEKNETNESAPANGNLVFPNYKVTYTANTAYTTTSNTKDWEYVGLSYGTEKANIKMGGTAVTDDVQTIKFWDYAANSYTFTAVSAKPEDLAEGRVVINKLTSDDDSKYEKGYTVTLTKTGTAPDFVYPSLADLYFSDRNEIAKGTGKDRTAKDAYGGNVTLQFRNSLTQVRAGVYETIPGYNVTAIHFYVTGDTEAKVSSTSAFGVIAPNIGTNYEGTLTVTYYDDTDTDTKNHPKLSFTGTPADDLILGTNMSTLSTTNALGTSAATPTWDTGGGTFTPVLPQINNTTDMKLKVDYTLYNEVTKETIEIKGKTAEVPGKYLAWKPNFKYTYLFKITDSDLYPITFDAVVIEAENGEVEYITTVSEPSITTFGVKGNKYQVGKDQYEATSDVYATIVDGGTVIDPTSKYNVYTVTTTNATTYPITEGSVAESLAEVSAKTHNVTCTAYTTNVTVEATVPGEDGKDITLPAGKAIKMAGLAAGTYAVEYVKSAATYKAQEVTYATQAEYDAAFAATNLYTNAAMTDDAAAGSWTDATTKFYKKVVDNAGVYAYKVIVVQ